MKTYINGIGLISPQPSFEKDFTVNTIAGAEGQYAEVILPQIKEYLSPKVYRRMSKIIRMGVISTMIAMKDAGVEEISGVLIGTGLGCVQNTEKFLSSVATTNEELSNPSAFINSTHNTIAGQIGLVLKNNGYNTTYTQEGVSFEVSLLDAFLHTKEQPSKNWIVGGMDEVTSVMQDLYAKNTDTKEVWGEGAGTFLLSGTKASSTYAELIGIHTLQGEVDKTDLTSLVTDFLQRYSLTVKDIDLVLTGDHFVEKKLQNFYSSKELRVVDYKKFCGNFHTSSSFAVGLAAMISKNKRLSQDLYEGEEMKGYTLIHTSYFDNSQGLILIKNV